jgi:broad specificity phosphatase PhoE
MTEFWLVRHGQTDWNSTGRFQGQTNIPLNSIGVLQARDLVQQLGKAKFAAIYSSDLIRAAQTALIISLYLHLPVVTDVRLREICQGEWEGLSLSEVRGKYEVDLTQTNASPQTSRAPGGESVIEDANRMSAAADLISARYPKKKVLLVSHGLAVATLFCLANKLPLTDVHTYIPENATHLVIQWPRK